MEPSPDKGQKSTYGNNNRVRSQVNKVKSGTQQIPIGSKINSISKPGAKTPAASYMQQGMKNSPYSNGYKNPNQSFGQAVAYHKANEKMYSA